MVYPQLARLMSMKCMNQKNLSNIIGRSQQITSKKLNGESDFKRSEMQLIKAHFIDIEPDITMDSIFERYIFLP